MIAPGIQSQMLRLLDGELSETELEALEAEIQRNPEALEAWRMLSNIHSELELLHEAQVQVSANPVVPIKRILMRQRRRFVRISLMAAAAVVLISGLALWIQSTPGDHAFRATFQVAPNSMFSLTNPGGDRSVEGEVKIGSELKIFHGAVELLLPNKVRVVAEAPASLRVLDEHTLQLDHGRAFFRVGSPEGRGFTVITPSQRIVDLGTAFGLEVADKRGETALHVFEGRVRVDGMDGETGEVVGSGRSVSIKGHQIAGEIDGSPPFFLRELPTKVKTVFVEDFESGLVAGRDYTVQVDPFAILDLAGNPFPGIADQTTWNFRVASPGVPVSVASYTYDGPERDRPSGHIPSTMQTTPFRDPGNSKLTDGDPGSAEGWASGTYVGFEEKSNGARGQITFDLGSVREIQEITFTTHLLTSGRLSAVRVSTSRDGVSFGSPVRMTPGFSGLEIVTGKLDPSQLGPARFFRLNFESAHEWIFLGEVEFIATAPSSAMEIPPPNHADASDGLELGGADKSPPALLAVYPADGAKGAPPGGALTMVFDEPVKFGRGRVILRNVTDWSEQEIVVGGSRTSVKGRVVTILPRTDLADGTMQSGSVAGWESDYRVALLNPSGDGKWYSESKLATGNRGVTGAMLGQTMVTMGAHHSASGIQREFSKIAPVSLYVVSVAVGVRDAEAEDGGDFLGYTIRLVSGQTLLCETSAESPPGAPNSVTSVGLSWDSSVLPAGVKPGDPLSIEIRPARNSGLGYLDIDHVRVSVVEKPGI